MDVFLVLAGRSKHGKDTVKEIALKRGAKGSIALVDWFKVGLSKITGFPVDDFYSSKKDQPLIRSLILGERHLRQMVSLVGDNSEEEDWSYTRIPSGNYLSREFTSIRDLMRWFGQDFVAKNCGADFHCRVTDRVLTEKRNANKSNGINLYVISDARFPHEIQYWLDHHNNGQSYVYPVKVENPNAPKVSTITEDGVDKIPESLLFRTINNDGDLEHLEKVTNEVLDAILEDVAQKLNTKSVALSPSTTMGIANKDTTIARRLKELGIDPNDPPSVRIAKMKEVRAKLAAEGKETLGVEKSVIQDVTPPQKNGEEDDTITEEDVGEAKPYYKEGDPTNEMIEEEKEAKIDEVSNTTQSDQTEDSKEKSQEKPMKKRGRPKGAKDKNPRTRAKAQNKDKENKGE